MSERPNDEKVVAEQLSLDGNGGRLLLHDGQRLRYEDEPKRAPERPSAGEREVVVAEQLNFEGHVGRLLVLRRGLLRWRAVRHRT